MVQVVDDRRAAGEGSHAERGNQGDGESTRDLFAGLWSEYWVIIIPPGFPLERTFNRDRGRAWYEAERQNGKSREQMLAAGYRAVRVRVEEIG